LSCISAAYLHPGSEKEGIGYKSNHYSFNHNFLSELEELKTNTNQYNPAIIRKNNTPSMLLFNGGLILIGATLMLFYIQFKEVFEVLNDSKKTQFYARLSNQYLLGYLSFCILLFIYLGILFFGPEIGPGKNFTEAELMLQVIAQKATVLTFMISNLHQVYGFHKLLRERNL
tara:strand:+ start:31866 stop:32381 length:516 start_codon:yes stop_codon:yes gene_type:complete